MTIAYLGDGACCFYLLLFNTMLLYINQQTQISILSWNTFTPISFLMFKAFTYSTVVLVLVFVCACVHVSCCGLSTPLQPYSEVMLYVCSCQPYAGTPWMFGRDVYKSTVCAAHMCGTSMDKNTYTCVDCIQDVVVLQIIDTTVQTKHCVSCLAVVLVELKFVSILICDVNSLQIPR